MEADVAAIADPWIEHGAVQSERYHAVVVTVWRSGMSVDEIERILDPLERDGLLEWVGLALPHERTRSAHEDIEFALDAVQHLRPVASTSWVGDDPYWAEHDLDDPEFLAYVQRLVSEDEQVARALERGQHDRVLTYIAQIAAANSGRVPPAEGSPFED